MPTFRCLNEECGEEWFLRRELDPEPECPECGEPGKVVDAYDDDPDDAAQEPAAEDQPRIGFARKMARKVLSEHGITEPPVCVNELAQERGFKIVPRATLGDLRGRLRGSNIEIAASDHEHVQRFSIAHEIGHDVLQTTHSDGSPAEKEADTFAGELLVPGFMLEAALATTTSVEALHRQFRVSREALKIAARDHQQHDGLTP